MGKFKSILVLSDLHAPYGHPDTVPFLRALKKKYKPDKIVCIGDEIDGQSWSMHDHDPDLDSPGAELENAIKQLKPIYDLFPNAVVVDSNHGSLIFRRQRKYGIPEKAIKAYREVIDAPKGWTWVFDITLTMSNGEKVYFCHGKSGRPGALSKSIGMSCVQGHYHEKFEIIYWANSNGLYWDARTSCLIDDSSRAFAYNNTNLHRPIIGTLVILNGHPKLEPMVLNKKGRWTGRLV